MKATITSLLMAMAVLLSYATNAAETQSDQSALPGYYPDSFASQGELQAVELSSGSVIINATRYGVDLNVKVHSLNTQHSSVHSLKPGLKVGYATRTQSDGKDIVYEIWILPPDMDVAR